MKKDRKSILSQSSWWMVNKAITKNIGLDASVLLSDLLSKSEYFFVTGKLDKEGFFYNDKSKIEEATSISPYRQNLAIEILLEKRLISIKKEGMPKRFYYKVHKSVIDDFVYELGGIEED
jgi:hypothetical protein